MFGEDGLEVAHEGREVEVGCFDEDVEVVGHEHISVDEHAVSLLGDGEEPQHARVEFAVGVGFEDELCLEAAVGDEVDGVFALLASFSSHTCVSLLLCSVIINRRT